MTSPAASYHGYRFPPEIIGHAVWLYHRFCLSFRDAEDLLAQRGITVSYEAIRQWCRRFGPEYARRLRRQQGRLGDTWYLDELFVTIQGRQQYLWRAVDQDGDVIDILVQPRRDRRAGEALTYRFSTVEQGRAIRTYSTAACRTCALKPQCTRNKESRRITRWEEEAVLERMEQRVSEHPEIMRKRKMLAEHPFGTIKRGMHQGYFLTCGLAKVGCEFSLTVLAYNLRRVINLVGVPRTIAALP